MEALWLKSQGLEHQEICRLAGVSSNTLRKYLRLFQAGGIKPTFRTRTATISHFGKRFSSAAGIAHVSKASGRQ
jgi:transposase-like protein